MYKVELRMARSKSDHQTGRLFRRAAGQEKLFEKSYEEELEARRGRTVECLGLTFENDDARRAHFLGKLKEGLNELHGKLGGVPFTSIEDAVARVTAIETWPMGDDVQLRKLAEGMCHAESSKDLLQRWKDEVGFPHGDIEDILKLSDPPYYTACPNPFLGEFVEAHGAPYDPESPTTGSHLRSMSAKARRTPSIGRMPITPRSRTWRSCRRSCTTPSPVI